jgi:hypothetical protein
MAIKCYAASFCWASVTDARSSVQLHLTETVQVGLWGHGPGGEDLEVVVNGPPIVKLEFPDDLRGFPDPNLTVFEMTGVSTGQTTLEARVPRTGTRGADPLQVTVIAGTEDESDGLSKFYHGTTLEQAKKLMMMDLEPFAVMEAFLQDINEYTDFGKGFYTHPEESKEKAVEWAKRKSKDKDWGVVRFSLTAEEMERIRANPAPLHFPDKFQTRPSNSPKLFNDQPATWIEFVEFNRHIRTHIQRPKDNDWTADFAWMRGPIWGRPDSHLPGPPSLPDRYHQINWGRSGMGVLNEKEPKKRRFLFTKRNEGRI